MHKEGANFFLDTLSLTSNNRNRIKLFFIIARKLINTEPFFLFDALLLQEVILNYLSDDIFTFVRELSSKEPFFLFDKLLVQKVIFNYFSFKPGRIPMQVQQRVALSNARIRTFQPKRAHSIQVIFYLCVINSMLLTFSVN